VEENKSKTEDLVIILKTKNQIYAEMVKESLEGDGINVLLKSVMGHHLRGMLPMQQDFFDYSLYVRAAFADKAREVVEIIVPQEEIL